MTLYFFCGPQDSDSESVAAPPVMDETYEPEPGQISKHPNNPIPSGPPVVVATPARSMTACPEVPVTSAGSFLT